MPLLMSWSIARYEDAVLEINLTPPIAIGGWSIHTRIQKRFGVVTSGLIDKYMSSGYYGVSGMNIVNSGAGIFNVAINSVETSGLDYGNYAYSITRTDSGSRSVLVEGYATINPDTF